MPDRHVIVKVDEIYHHGILGQKWGVRRFQNADGSLTKEGMIRYGSSGGSSASNKSDRKFSKMFNKANAGSGRATKKLLKSEQMKNLIDDDELKRKYARSKIANDRWYEKSKGEDYDGFEPDKNGYDENYGITTKEFEKIRKLDDERYEAKKDFTESLEKRAKDFVNTFNENVSVEDLLKSRGDNTQAEYWLSKQMKKALNQDSGFQEILKQETEKSKKAARAEENKEYFDQAKKDIKKEGAMSWWMKKGSNNSDSLFEHVHDTQGDLLDKWWKERNSASIEDGSWDRLQQKYTKQLAKNLDLPQTKETYDLLADLFINGDD